MTPEAKAKKRAYRRQARLRKSQRTRVRREKRTWSKEEESDSIGKTSGNTASLQDAAAARAWQEAEQRRGILKLAEGGWRKH